MATLSYKIWNWTKDRSIVSQYKTSLDSILLVAGLPFLSNENVLESHVSLGTCDSVTLRVFGRRRGTLPQVLSTREQFLEDHREPWRAMWKFQKLCVQEKCFQSRKCTHSRLLGAFQTVGFVLLARFQVKTFMGNTYASVLSTDLALLALTRVKSSGHSLQTLHRSCTF